MIFTNIYMVNEAGDSAVQFTASPNAQNKIIHLLRQEGYRLTNYEEFRAVFRKLEQCSGKRRKRSTVGGGILADREEQHNGQHHYL